MKSFFTTRPLAKAVSVVLAVLLWIFVHSEQRVDVGVNVKLQIANKPQDLVISGELEPFINLRLNGPRSRINRMVERGFDPYVLDLKDAQSGVVSFRIFDEDFKVPRGTRITRISPQVIRLVLDRAEERLIRVRPRLVGELEEGFELVAHEVNPPYLKVTGARRDLATISSLETEPIPLSGRRESFEGTYSVHLPENLIEEGEKKVEVKVTIREREVARLVEDVPVRVAGVSRALKVEPNTVSLRVRGPAGAVATVMDEKLEIEIDARKLGLEKRGQRAYRIRPAPPRRPGVEITMIPDNVLVRLAQD